jgi:long-chain fatty acid transport protein
VPALLGADPRFQDGDGGARMVTPSITTLSIMYGVTDAFRVLADYQSTGWSSLQDVTIKRSNGTVVGSEDFRWQDTDFFSVGVEFDLNEAFTLRAGVGADESPTNDATRTPRLPDDDRMLYSVGMSWAMSDHLTIDAAYQRITIEDPEINLGVHLPSDLSTLQGTYSGSANLFGVSMQYRF